MKLSLLFSAFFLSLSAYAEPVTLQCTTKYNETYIADARKNYDDFYENCQVEVIMGEICFTGKRADVISYLKEIAEAESFDDGMGLVDIGYYGKNEIKYDVYDYPNETVLFNNQLISRCE